MTKMGMNAKLGGLTEEILSSIKLIISFGKEKDMLNEYKDLAELTFNKSKTSSMLAGSMMGIFFGLIIGFVVFSWAIGFVFIKWEIKNPRTDEVTTVSEVVSAY